MKRVLKKKKNSLEGLIVKHKALLQHINTTRRVCSANREFYFELHIIIIIF